MISSGLLSSLQAIVLSDLATILPYALLLLATFWGLWIAINGLKGVGNSGGLPHATVNPPFDYNKALNREWRKLHKQMSAMDKLEKEYDKNLASFDEQVKTFDQQYAEFKELRKRV